MSNNYYIILGVNRNSSQKDIRLAYRRLAKEFHPDRYGENQAPFQIIQEAYSVLSNPETRKSYDHSLQPESRFSSSVKQSLRNRYANEIVEPLIPENDQYFIPMNRLHSSINQHRFIKWYFFKHASRRFF